MTFVVRALQTVRYSRVGRQVHGRQISNASDELTGAFVFAHIHLLPVWFYGVLNSAHVGAVFVAWLGLAIHAAPISLAKHYDLLLRVGRLREIAITLDWLFLQKAGGHKWDALGLAGITDIIVRRRTSARRMMPVV